MDDRLIAPLSFAQQRLWLVNALRPDSPAYNVRTAYRLRGRLDAAALQRSLQTIVGRHETLRTTFAVVDGEPMQIITPGRDLRLVMRDVTELDPCAREAEAHRLLGRVANAPFDLTAGPLFRVLLVRCAPDDHVLLFVMHHIIFDGGSVAPFNRELTALYAGLSNGTAPVLDDLPIAYADFAVWQRNELQGYALARQLAYWREALAGAPPRVELATDAPHRAGQDQSGAIRSAVLSTELAGRLAALGRAHGATFFVTLLAAFNALLYRYTGQTDLVVGSPIANRRRTELEPLIGFFVNTLALRTRVNGTTSFDQLVHQTRETALAAFEHQDLPFERLVAERQPERSGEDTPLVNVMFFGRTDPDVALQLTDVAIERYPLAGTSAKFDLSFRYAHEAHGLTCSVQYATSLFTAAAIERMLLNFAQLVEAAVNAPAAPIGSLPMLARAERERLLGEWNAQPAGSACDLPLRERFEAQAALAPDAAAVVCGAVSLTYHELNARANQLARALHARGVRPEDIVAVALERSAWTIVSMLAILKAGAAYLPLDLSYPLERLRFMIDDARARVVIAQRAGIERLDGGVAPERYFDLDAVDLAEHETADFSRAGAPDDLAYVMYTSGSTGSPKGVLINQRAVGNLVCAPTIAVSPADVVAQIASISFDAATFEIWGALLNGARLEIIRREVVLEPDALAAFMRERQISVAFVTSALLRHISRHAPGAFATLRCLIAGGETLDPAAVRAILTHGPPQRLLNGYGPTETTTFATTFEIATPPHDRIPIGRPIANVQTYILDADGNAAPIGARGQLHIGGLGLAHGYLNDRESTSRRFISHPFSADPLARLYATGDFARYLPDGNIEFLGRSDRQVKIRGFRIELGEVEAALKALPSVADAVATIREDEPGEPRLVAYVVDDASPARPGTHWREALACRLPQYMLPDAVVAVAAIPLTANGKVDTGALAGSLAAAPAVSAARAADPPASAIEHALTHILRDVLGIALVGRQDDFFALGGHSLLATRVIARIFDRFAVELSVRDFFAGPTVAELARRISSAAPRAVRPIRSPADARVAGLSDEQIDALLAETLRE